MDFTVPGSIALVRQPDNNTCWAATATMLRSWNEKRSMTIEEALSLPLASTFLAFFKGHLGLRPELVARFANVMGFQSEPMAIESMTADKFLRLMKKHGPLGVVTFQPLHARVLYGMWGDGTSGYGTQIRILNPIALMPGWDYYPHFAQEFEPQPEDTETELLETQIWHY